MSWIGRISQNRIQGQVEPGAAKKKAVVKAPAAKLEGTLISDRVLKRYGQTLASASGDMQHIAQSVNRLRTHRAAQFTNAVDQFYSALGRSTDHLEPAQRDEVVKASVKAMRGLVDSVSPKATLMPAMAALTALLEPRGKLGGVSAKDHAEAAKTEVLALVDRASARVGASSILFGFRNLVEAYETGRDNLKSADRPPIWSAVSDYLDAVVPRPGCGQGQLGIVTGLALKALRETPQDPTAALDSAKAQALAPLKETRKALLLQLDVVPQGVQEGTEAKSAFDAMNAALKKVVYDNLLGPEDLFQAIEQLQGKMAGLVQVGNNAALAKGYGDLARIIPTIGRTSASVAVFQNLASQLPALVTHDASRALLAKAAGVKTAEGIAPLIVEAHLARMNRNPQQNQMVDPLNKLGRLPPGPALRAAIALLPQIAQAHAPQLAEALHVESRTAESAEELAEFVERFVGSFPQFRNLGAEAGPLASAFARETSGKPDANIARQLAQTFAQAKVALPNTSMLELLQGGKNGEAGLIALSDVKSFIHNPSAMAIDLLRVVAAQRPKGPNVAEARVALGIAGELGRFDRNPTATDFVRVKADLTTALNAPQGLTYAKGMIKGRAAKSMLDVLAKHPEIPTEIALTASQTLDQGTMTWLHTEMQTTRSNDYKRLLRDSLFAASASDQGEFFTVLATSPSDRKAKEAALNMVAGHHRQGQTATIPWAELAAGLKAGTDPATELASKQAAEAMAGFGLQDLANVDPVGMANLQRAKPQLESLLTFLGTGPYNQTKEFFVDIMGVAVKAQAEGSWPAQKYESESAKEHLAPLAPEQLEAWKQNMVTGAQAAAVPADDPEALQAMQLMKGVAQTLRKHASVGGRGFEDVTWTQASLKKLQGQHTELLGKLRNAKKGSAAHRKLSRQIGPVRKRVALLELNTALKQNFRKDAPARAPQAVLAELKPLAMAALSPLRAQKAYGLCDALTSAADAVKAASGQTARTGNYACDDDTLDAYLTAFSGGCINPTNGFNRGSLVELITGSQYKMIRMMHGDKPVGRSFLRLVRAEMANGYKGMALRMDPPQASTGGNPNANDKALMYKHALAKAAAMGVPLLVSDATVAPAVQERGLAIANVKSKVYVHKGVTGMHHNQGMWNGDYFIAWPGITVANRGQEPAADLKECGMDYSFQTVMPPGWKA